MVCFLFCRPTLVELRVLPRCPVTLWVYSEETCCSCNLRIGLLILESVLKTDSYLGLGKKTLTCLQPMSNFVECMHH